MKAGLVLFILAHSWWAVHVLGPWGVRNSGGQSSFKDEKLFFIMGWSRKSDFEVNKQHSYILTNIACQGMVHLHCTIVHAENKLD